MIEKVAPNQKEYLQLSELGGIFVPTNTPFKKFFNKIQLDVDSHMRHIARLADPSSGINGIFLGSNAGQCRDMDMKNLKLSISTGIKTSKLVNKKLPVVVGALRKNIDEVLEIAKFAQENGANAIVLAPGYINEDFNKILKVVSDQTDLPIIIYNNPWFQKNQENLPMEFYEAALENPKVIGIKDTSSEVNGSMKYFEEVFRLFKAKGRRVMQGNTKAGLDILVRAADGMVPMEANLYPELIADVFNPNKIYSNARSELVKMFGLIDSYRGAYGGSSGFIKHMLVKQGIFKTALKYPTTK